MIALVILSPGYSTEKTYSSKIIQNMVKVMDSTNTALWINDHNTLSKAMIDQHKFKKVDSCKKANVLIITSNKKVPSSCSSKPMLALKYNLLKNNPNVVSAFFWQKGRPNIVFLKDRLKKFNITLPSSYTKYIEEKIW